MKEVCITQKPVIKKGECGIYSKQLRDRVNKKNAE
jgi:hypothetical protein